MLPTTFWTWVITSCPSGGELLVAIGSCADFRTSWARMGMVHVVVVLELEDCIWRVVF